MTLHIELDPATEARLTEEARDRGLDLPAYAGELLSTKHPGRPIAKPPLTVEQFHKLRRQIAGLGPEEMPPASQTWPRSIIYSDHD